MDVRKDDLELKLARARDRFHDALGSVPAAAWRAPSANPGWTNAQLMFHVLLGFILVPPLLGILRLMARLPGGVDRAFARLLNASTPLFNWVNALGPRVGARLLTRAAMGRQFDRVHHRLRRQLAAMDAQALGRGMHYPTRWDPRFRPVMTAADLFDYPVAHLEHHLAQLAPGPNAPT